MKNVWWIGPFVRGDVIAERRGERTRAAKLEVRANCLALGVVSLDLFPVAVIIA